LLAATAITPSAWNFIAATHAAGAVGTLTNAQIYKDGVSVASGNLHSPQAVARTNALMRSNYLIEYGGLLSVYAMWRRELTATEMRRLKAAYEFGARPKELVFASARHSVSDRCGMSAAISSGISAETGTNLYGFKRWWRPTGGGLDLLQYGPSQSYVVGTGDFELEIIFIMDEHNATGELQCLIDFGTVPGNNTTFTYSYPEEFNQIVRRDGFCVSFGKRIVNNSYPNVTDTALLVGAGDNMISNTAIQNNNQYPWAPPVGLVHFLSLKRKSGTMSYSIFSQSSYVQGQSFTNTENMTADRFTLFNFNQDIGPGNWPFKGKIISARLWKGISFDRGTNYAAIP
jgi:hypothetical protein